MNKITINISEFFQSDCKAIYLFLLQQKAKEFEIIMPREYMANRDDDIEIMTEYLAAAYTGQLLAQISENFGYQVSCPKTIKPFVFHLTVLDLERFADILFSVIQGNNCHGNELGYVDFQVEASQFLIHAYDEDYECHTWGLLHIAQKMLSDLG